MERCTTVIRMGTGATVHSFSCLRSRSVVCGGQNVNCFISSNTGRLVFSLHQRAFLGSRLRRMFHRLCALKISSSRLLAVCHGFVVGRGWGQGFVGHAACVFVNVLISMLIVLVTNIICVSFRGSRAGSCALALSRGVLEARFSNVHTIGICTGSAHHI